VTFRNYCVLKGIQVFCLIVTTGYETFDAMPSGQSKLLWATKIAGNVLPPTTSLSRQVPRAQQLSDRLLNQDRELSRNAFVYCINHLSAFEEDAMACKQYLEGRRQTRATTLSEEGHFTTNACFSKTNSDFLAKELMAASCLSQQNLELAVEYDPQALIQLGIFQWSLLKNLRWPAECISIAVLHNTLKERTNECGRRLSLWNGSKLGADGRIDWAKHGIYAVIYEEGIPKKIKHKPTSTTVELPSYVVLNENFAFLENWSEEDAQVGVDGSSHKLKSFFQGEHARIIVPVWNAKSKPMKDAVKRAVAVVEAALHATSGPASSSSSSAAFGETPRKRKAGENAMKALEALKLKREDSAKKRRASLKKQDSEPPDAPAS
jgi:hypothetical protein